MDKLKENNAITDFSEGVIRRFNGSVDPDVSGSACRFGHD